MTNTGLIGLLLIVVNFLFSYKGFSNHAFFDAYKFQVDKILLYKDYKRLITSGFLHVNWLHLIFNMFSLYAFSGAVESGLGSLGFLLVYFASLLGGGLLSLMVHKNHGDYSAVGASGAVCGVIFASIALFPQNEIGFFFIPVGIPAWIFGVFYIGFSIYGIKSAKDNIGHEAHLGGALVGMIVALIMQPSSFVENYITILLIAVPAIVFIYLIITRPYILLIDNFYFKKQKKFHSIDEEYNMGRKNKEEEIDRILDKISTRGMNSLSNKEKDFLKKNT